MPARGINMLNLHIKTRTGSENVDDSCPVWVFDALSTYPNKRFKVTEAKTRPVPCVTATNTVCRNKNVPRKQVKVKINSSRKLGLQSMQINEKTLRRKMRLVKVSVNT